VRQVSGYQHLPPSLTITERATLRAHGADGALSSKGEVRLGPIKRPFDPGSVVTESIVPRVVELWADVRFPPGEESSEAGLRELIAEATEDALDDNDEAAAVAWADGYEFPERFLETDVKHLEASELDFEVMVRRRQRQLAPDRLSLERVSRLHTDNPEMMMMIDLPGGMRVHLPEGFKPNGFLPRTPLRDL
jgi:hypothetical protein